MKKNKKILHFLIIGIITVIVLYFSLKDHFFEIVHQVIHLNPFWFLIAILLAFGYWAFKSIEFYLATKRFKPDFSYHEAIRMTLATSFFNAITPFGSGGQPFQIYMLKKAGLRLSDSTNVIIENFIVYQIALILLSAFAVIANMFGNFYDKVGFLSLFVAFGLFLHSIVVVGLFLVAFNLKFNRWVSKNFIHLAAKFHFVKDEEKKREEFESYIIQFHEGAKVLLTNKRLFINAIGFNLIALLSQYLIPVVLLYSTGDYTSFDGFLSIVTSAYVMLIGSSIPIPGGTGGLEYGFLMFFGNFINGGKLNAIMLLWRGLTYYFGLIVGAIAFNMKGKK